MLSRVSMLRRGLRSAFLRTKPAKVIHYDDLRQVAQSAVTCGTDSGEAAIRFAIGARFRVLRVRCSWISPRKPTLSSGTEPAGPNVRTII